MEEAGSTCPEKCKALSAPDITPNTDTEKCQANGNLEYHFLDSIDNDESRPAVSLTHVTYATTAADHPTACYIPKQATDRPSIVVDPDRLEDLFRPEGAPPKLGDYLNKDIPQMGLHVVSFLDKTLINVHFPHTLMDGMSMAAFLDAWILILQDHASEIKCPIGAESDSHQVFKDPLAAFNATPTVKHVLAGHHMSIIGLAGWALHNFSSFLDVLENRMVCVPASVIARLHKEAIVDSAIERKEDESPPFLSDGDVLCAWWTRLFLTTAGVTHDPNKIIVLNSAYSLRPMLDSNSDQGSVTQTATNRGNIYVSNIAAFFSVILTAGDIIQQPLYRTALAIRKALNTQRTRPQAGAFLHMWRMSWGRVPPIFGHWKMDLITYSNWTKAELFDVDFSAAAVRTEGPGRPVRPTYIQNNQFGLELPNAFQIMGKDSGGNYWLSGYLRRGHWGRVEGALANYSTTTDAHMVMEQ